MATGKGGDRLQAQLGDIGKRMAGASTVRVGFLEDATYPDGKPVAMIAAIHNFGKWPFFTDMIEAKKAEWPAAISGLLRSTGYDAAKTLDQTGHAIAGQLRQAIIDTVSPSNAPSTIARKGFDKPLVETGHMLQSVDYQVKA